MINLTIRAASLSCDFDLQPENNFFSSHNSLLKEILVSNEKQEEISRFISRFDCLPCFLLHFRPQKTWAARTAQDIDTNSIELKSKIKEGEKRRKEEKYLKSKLLLLVSPSLGKYSIKILSKWIFSLEIFSFSSLLWNFHSMRDEVKS